MKKKVRIRIKSTDSGIEIIGDSMYDYVLEDILTRAGAKEIERSTQHNAMPGNFIRSLIK